MSFPRYEKYRDSGVEMVGQVPATWALVLLKRVASICYGIGEPPVYRPEGVPLVRATNVHAGRLYPDGLVYVDPLDIPAKRIVWLLSGDIIVVRSGAYTGDSAIIPKDLGPAIAGFDMVLRCHSLLPKFCQWALLSSYLKSDQIDLLRLRAAQPHLNAEELGGCTIAVPPADEQAQISAFLDRETAKIDALVEEQKRLVELLKEKRQAVISHAVTKGLNPNAPMKDSGVDWLGDVPAHWDVRALKHIVSTPITDGPHETPNFPDEGIPFVSAEAVSGGFVDFNRIRGFISAEDHARYSQKYLPRRGDIFMVKSGATTGVTAIVETDDEFNIWSPLAVIRCGTQCSPYFVLHFMRSKNFLEAVTLNWSFGTQQNIGMGVIENLSVTVPPIEEQLAIAEYLSTHAGKLDGLVREAQGAISLLQERRTALISAAVTGKIDVRSKVPHPDPTPA